ncbi:MAG: segregation/condensation protein A [Bdellovibrionales bacterium]|nr:segregation/condensation protein A [Bdellovibrionales bacterium]
MSTTIPPEPFTVAIEQFDGPIDLLLHLVKSRELAIETVSLAAVCTQYLECIEKMRRLDLDIAAEYLVIAATLLSIKASVLLDDPIEEITDEETGLSPHQELLLRLKEAEVFKDYAQKLGQRNLLGQDVFASPPSLGEIEVDDPGYRDHDSMLLGEAFRKLLERSGADHPMLRFEFDPISVVERMVGMLDRLREAGGAMSFARLVNDVGSRSAVITAFVAMLELCKRRAIVIAQEEVFDEITIALSGEGLVIESLTSEFDQDSNQPQELGEMVNA